MAEVRLTPRAHGLLLDLPAEARVRLTDALRQAGERPDRELRPLEGYPYFSVRSGDYRALIDWDREAGVLWVFAVGHRRSVYDRFLPP